MRQLAALLVVWLPALSASGAVYHVDSQGSDSGDGSETTPFSTISACAAKAVSGDVCRVHAGTYRETVVPPRDGEDGAPIRFEAAPGECVTLQGTDPFDGEFIPYEGNIWVADTKLEFIQLFDGETMLSEARWPNKETDDLQELPQGIASDGTHAESLVDPEIPPGDWTGAMIFIIPGEQWQSDTRQIASYDEAEKRIEFDTRIGAEASIEPTTNNPYYLYNSLLALDAPGEWYLDIEEQKLYIVPEDGVDPNEMALAVKQRGYGFDVQNRKYIEIAGFGLFATAVRIEDSSHCVVDGIDARFVSHVREADSFFTAGDEMLIDGDHHTFKNSTITHSALSGILVKGSDHRIENNVVTNVAYMAPNRAGIDVTDYNLRNERIEIIGNTVSKSGRSGIFLFGARGSRVLYNRVSKWALQSRDMGGIYTWGTDGEGTEIAFNELFDGQCDWGAGIYIDDASRGFIIHHNYIHDVLWYGIQIKKENAVFNNTILDVHGSPLSVEKNIQTGIWELDGAFCVNNLDDGAPRLKVTINTTDVTDYGSFERVVKVPTADRWTHVEVPFDQLRQPPWAIPVPFDPSVAVTLNFTPMTLGDSMFLIDNIQLEKEGESFMVDDFEDGNGVTLTGGGLWTGGGDGAEASGKIVDDGASDSKKAYRVEGTLNRGGWANFVVVFGKDETEPYDISEYHGFSFDIKGESRVRFDAPQTMPYQEKNSVCPVDDTGVPTSDCAVDQGVLVPPFTNGFEGDGPDIGAYESGVSPFTVGANFALEAPRCGERKEASYSLPPWAPYPADLFKTEPSDTADSIDSDTGLDTDTASEGDVDSDSKKGETKPPASLKQTDSATADGCGCAATGSRFDRSVMDMIRGIFNASGSSNSVVRLVSVSQPSRS